MTDQIEASIDAGGQYVTWKYDSRGFPISLYTGETMDEAIERMDEQSLIERVNE